MAGEARRSVARISVLSDQVVVQGHALQNTSEALNRLSGQLRDIAGHVRT